VNIIKQQKTALTARDKGDLLNMLLADKRSENTKRAYRRDLTDFFNKAFNQDADQATVARFLSLTREQMTFAVLDYKADLLEKGLTESTVNRRITAIKSLVNFAYRTGQLAFKLDIPGEKVKAYRDTRGTDAAGIKRLLLQPDRSTVKGLRDYAILSLLWANGLRRSEIVKLDVKDFRPETDQVFILGKGRGSQKEPATITGQTKAAIIEYLETRGEAGPGEPLFTNCDRAGKGSGRLTGEALYYMLQAYSKKAGFEKPLTPHKVRHSSITAALDTTGGDIRKVRHFSRHAKLETVAIYDDNRADVQGDISQLLAAQI